MKKILLIEDDESFGYILSEYLSLHEYEIVWAKSGEEGLQKLKNGVFDLGIFDIMLPAKNGYEVAVIAKQQQPGVPFIFLSAKSLKIDKLKGFKVGADDYITKPIDEELLLAKIKAIIKRSTGHQQPQADIFSIGAYEFIFSLQELKNDNQTIRLTQRESALLKLFCQHKNQLLPRKKALREIWGSTDEFSRKSMDVFVSHLRKYLAADARIQIVNVHGKGFVFTVREYD